MLPRERSLSGNPPTSSSFEDIFIALAPALKNLEELLEQQCEIFEPGVATCVRYVVSNQGKRLRPSLVILSGNCWKNVHLGSTDEELLNLCAIVELVHIATLIHDDIMDGAELRRNRLTAGAKWGQEISVLLGDCLFAHALMLAASFSDTRVCRRVAEATNIVCSGEILQTQRRFDLKLSEADYLKMIEMKTGALFAVACELGAYWGGASEAQMREAYEMGRLLGIAYQIYDDCVDIIGAEKEIGKSLGTDFQKGKLTLPVILLLQRAQESEMHLISSLLLNEHANSRVMLVDFINRYGTMKDSAAKAQSLLAQAAKVLASMPGNEGRCALETLIHYLESKLAEVV